MKSKILLIRLREPVFRCIFIFIINYLISKTSVEFPLLSSLMLSSVVFLFITFFCMIIYSDIDMSYNKKLVHISTTYGLFKKLEYFTYKGSVYSTVVDSLDVYVYKRVFFCNICVGQFIDSSDINIYQDRLRTLLNDYISKKINNKLKKILENNRFKHFNTIE